ncbi:MAG: CerR family C-terminal domain-containing protein [Planctomycetes bacterium]|nr:CerR family C-terminal domain-containing protein [Planctomycetota bacterium]
MLAANSRQSEHPPVDASDETRARLVEAAGEVFARRGYRSATIRDICIRAQANVAAIHYHFGDKEALYNHVLRDSLKTALKQYPPSAGLSDGANARERLRAFIRSLLFRTLDDGPAACHGQLMLREMAEPSPALDELVRQGIRPLYELLGSIVRDLYIEYSDGRPPAPRAVRRCAQSVIGQCIYHRLARPVLERLLPDLKYNKNEVAELAEHIAEFSIAGIAHCARIARRTRR